MAAKKTEGFTANVEGFTANVSANVPVEVQPQQGGAPMEEVAAVSEGWDDNAAAAPRVLVSSMEALTPCQMDQSKCSPIYKDGKLSQQGWESFMGESKRRLAAKAETSRQNSSATGLAAPFP